jgi:hypothetical protein
VNLRPGLGPRRLGLLALSLLTTLAADQVRAQVYISEIYFNLPGRKNFNTDPDSSHAYVEIRGEPLATLTNTYLLFIENEAEGAGTIEGLFDLDGFALGENGYLTIRQRTVTDPSRPSQYNDYALNPLATNLRNEAPGPDGLGFGKLGHSTIGASWSTPTTGAFTGGIDGSGFTALLIKTDDVPESVPQIEFDLDVDNNGFDVAGGNAGWTILDSIGIFAEANEALDGRTYAPLTYGFESTADFPDFDPAEHIPEGGQYVFLNWPELEAEYIARWGESTGHAPEDWLVSNLTDRPEPAGFTNMGDFRQSSEPQNSNDPLHLEASQFVPYGTVLTATVGGPNYPLGGPPPIPGDFDEDGDVDADDLNNEWMPRFALGELDGSDFLVWQQNLGTGVAPPPLSGPATAVPEPGAISLLVSGLAILARRRSTY